MRPSPHLLVCPHSSLHSLTRAPTGFACLLHSARVVRSPHAGRSIASGQVSPWLRTHRGPAVLLRVKSMSSPGGMDLRSPGCLADDSLPPNSPHPLTGSAHFRERALAQGLHTQHSFSLECLSLHVTPGSFSHPSAPSWPPRRGGTHTPATSRLLPAVSFSLPSSPEPGSESSLRPRLCPQGLLQYISKERTNRHLLSIYSRPCTSAQRPGIHWLLPSQTWQDSVANAVTRGIWGLRDVQGHQESPQWAGLTWLLEMDSRLPVRERGTVQTGGHTSWCCPQEPVIPDDVGDR